MFINFDLIDDVPLRHSNWTLTVLRITLVRVTGINPDTLVIIGLLKTIQKIVAIPLLHVMNATVLPLGCRPEPVHAHPVNGIYEIEQRII